MNSWPHFGSCIPKHSKKLRKSTVFSDSLLWFTVWSCVNKTIILLRSFSPNITGCCTACLTPCAPFTIFDRSWHCSLPALQLFIGSFINIYDRPIARKQTRAHPIHNTDQPVNEPRYPLNGHSVSGHSDIRRSLIHHFAKRSVLSKLPWCRSRSRYHRVYPRDILGTSVLRTRPPLPLIHQSPSKRPIMVIIYYITPSNPSFFRILYIYFQKTPLQLTAKQLK